MMKVKTAFLIIANVLDNCVATYLAFQFFQTNNPLFSIAWSLHTFVKCYVVVNLKNKIIKENER